MSLQRDGEQRNPLSWRLVVQADHVTGGDLPASMPDLPCGQSQAAREGLTVAAW